MGCFFGCFRIKDSKPCLITPSESVGSRSKNALSSLFLCDDESVRKGEEGRNQLPLELDVRELKNEVNFLKSCGTETPVEIRKTLEKWEDKSAQNGEEKSSKVNSSNASMEKLKLEKQPDESPAPVKICEDWVTESGSLLDSPSSRSCMTDGLNSGGVSSSFVQRREVQNVITPVHMPSSETHSEASSVTTQIFVPSVQCENKSLRFDCDSNKSGFSSRGSSSECVSRNSNHLRESLKLNDENNLISNPISELAVKSHSLGEEVKNEESLSSWFKPISAKQDGINKEFGSIFGEKVYRGRTPGDRPILGMVAAHWNDDETSRISPKWWDGNGIPNSTNKYKEDQKVSWHATPFEERLEKALSEETFLSQRKRINGTPPLELDETEESDTALSQLQSSAHIKSVVSF